MYVPVGFVLTQPGPGRIHAISIHGFPSEGWYVYPGKVNRRFSLVFQTAWLSQRGAAPGQGHLKKESLDAAGSDPTLFQENLSGGFVCKTDKTAVAVDYHCRFVLQDVSLFPFLFDPEQETQYWEKGRHDPEEVKYFEKCKQRPLATNVWYPVEISQEGRKAVYPGEAYETQGFAFGVFMLTEVDPSGKGVGILRYVYEKEEWDPNVPLVTLHRFGRKIGEAGLSNSCPEDRYPNSAV